MYKAASKESNINKTAIPDKNNKTPQSHVKKSKDTSLTQNGNDEKNKSAKKKKKEKDKEKDKEREKPKSERFMKIDQGNNKPTINKHKPPTGLAVGIASGSNNSPMKRKRDENKTAGGGTSMQGGDMKSISYKRLNMEGGQGR